MSFKVKLDNHKTNSVFPKTITPRNFRKNAPCSKFPMLCGLIVSLVLFSNILFLICYIVFYILVLI